jgi:hypothetical protein
VTKQRYEKIELKTTQYIAAHHIQIKFGALGINVALRARGRECKLVTNPIGCPLFFLTVQMV